MDPVPPSSSERPGSAAPGSGSSSPAFSSHAFSSRHPDLLLDLQLPDGGDRPAAGWPLVVWLHGGGWRMQDRTARPDFSRHFCPRGLAMASIDYRLAPHHTHPAQVLDLREALRWLRAHAGELGIDPGRIALWGSSAGAHVAACTALLADHPRLPGEDLDDGTADQPTGVSCVVDGYGPAQLADLLPDRHGEPTVRTTPEEDLLGGPATTPDGHAALGQRANLASPAQMVSAAPPPFLILHGTADTMVPARQSSQLHDHLLDLGGESQLYLIDGFGHGFFNPGEVAELGPGIRLDNGRLESEPHAGFSFHGRGSFDPQGRPASFDVVGDFLVHHLSRPLTPASH